MKPKNRLWKWLGVLILGLLVLPLISLGLGILWVTPVRVTRMPLSEDSASIGRPADASSDALSDASSDAPSDASSNASSDAPSDALSDAPSDLLPTGTPRPARLALNPQNRIHLFVVMPLLAGVAVLVTGGVGGVVWWTWLRTPADRTDVYGDDTGPDERSTLRFGLFILLLWMALSILFIFDLAGSASLYPLFVAVYAGFWILVGALLLYDRPLREKILILGLFLLLLVSLRFVNWNSRKPFLRDFYRIDVGMTYPQVERIMSGYERSFATDVPVDEQGQPVTGRVAYTHTDAAWGDSDVGLLTFENGRVAEIDFLPD